jgi:TolA-binding protein
VSTFARDSSYFYAISYYLEGDYQKAIEALLRLITDFPESPVVAEAYYHIGLSYTKLNDMNRAREAYKFLIDTYPDKQWATYARERLTEIASRGRAE